MSLRRTALAALLFAALTGLYLLDGFRIARRDASRAASTRLLPFPAGEISELGISSEGQVFTLAEQESVWRVTAPIQTGADPQAVEALLDEIDDQSSRPISGGSSPRWAALGLEKPPITVVIRSRSGRTARLAIGADTPVRGQVYARLDDGSEPLAVGASLRDQLRGGLFAFRDKRLLSIEPASINALSLTHDGVTILARREGPVWNLLRPFEGPADTGAVDAILDEIKLTKPVEFITTETMQLAHFGLEVPRFAVTAGTEWNDAEGPAGQTSTLLVGLRRLTHTPSYFAVRGGSQEVFTVPQALVDRLRADPSTLRNKSLFSITEPETTRLTILFGRSSVLLRRDPGGSWEAEDHPGVPLDQGFVRSIITRALKMKVAEHLPTQPVPQQTGLDAPTLVLQIEAGARHEGIRTGRTIPGRQQVYAASDGRDEVFALADDEPGRFLLAFEDFQDKALFSFDPAKVVVIEVSEGDKHWIFERQPEYWLCRPGAGREVFQIRSAGAEHFVLSMLGLKWKRRLDPADPGDAAEIQARGLALPRRTIRLLDAQGAELAAMAEGGAARNRIYIRRAGRDDFALEIQAYGPFIEALRSMFSVN